MPVRCPNHLSLMTVALLMCSLMLVFSGSLSAQDVGCNYDRTAPSLDNARLNFKSLHYRCAELELLDRLRTTSLTLVEKADTYVLLAAVYYAMLSDNEKKQRDKVVEQFTAAFREYRDWKGTLEISSSDFAALMEEAKRRVDAGEAPLESAGDPISMSAGPSSKTAWIGTGIFAASAGFFAYSAFNVGSKWDDYESNPGDPGLYDDYKSANSLRNIAGGVTLVTGLVTGYLWIKHKSAQKNYGGSPGAGLHITPAASGVLLTYRF